MRKAESYFLKDGKLDLSLLDEEVSVSCEAITYHKIRTIHEVPLSEEEQVAEGFKEKLYGSLETYEILREMGAYLSNDFFVPDGDEDLLIWNTVDPEAPEEEQLTCEEEAEVEEEEHLSYEEEIEAEEEKQLTCEEETEVEEEEQLTYEEETEVGEDEHLCYEEETGVEDEACLTYEQERLAEGRAEAYAAQIPVWEQLEAQGELCWEAVVDSGEHYSEVEAVKVEGTVDVGQVFAYQLSAADQEIIRQYEQPDRLLELQFEEKECSTIEKFRAYQLKLLQGRVLTQDIFSPQGVQVGRAGERITAELIERAKREGALIKIILKYL